MGKISRRKCGAKPTHAMGKADHARRQQPRSYDEYPRPIPDLEQAIRVGLGEAAFVQFHEHRSRCRKLPGGAHKYDLAFRQPMSEETTPPLQPPDDQSTPLPDPDNRVIPVTMRRPEDMYMAEFNVMQVVGGAEEAKAQVYYTCEYCTKYPINLQESLPLLRTARALATRVPFKGG